VYCARWLRARFAAGPQQRDPACGAIELAVAGECDKRALSYNIGAGSDSGGRIRSATRVSSCEILKGRRPYMIITSVGPPEQPSILRERARVRVAMR
jgi:hypothetical protein